jgi:hypothetical protein
MKKLLPAFIIFFFIQSVFNNSPVFAQSSDLSVGQTLIIDDKNAVTGDIMSLSTKPETLVRSTKEYDDRMFGVLQLVPVVVYKTRDDIPVIRTGAVPLNVTSLGGPILVGDYVTSSPIAGKGQKATSVSGNMLGVALTAYDGKAGTNVTYQGKTYKSGVIKAQVGIGPASPVVFKASGGLFGTLKQLQTALLFNITSSRNADKIMRYILAALLLLLLLGFGYYTFGKQITKGIEAIGRNPLAKASIQTMIVLNAILLGVVCVGGIILALVIISL